jgi:hypothetical protein
MFQYQTTVDVLGPVVVVNGRPELGSVLETIPAAVVDSSATVTDPATGRISVVQQWELYVRRGVVDLTSVTSVRGADGTLYDVSTARQSPFRRGEWLVLAKVRAE